MWTRWGGECRKLDTLACSQRCAHRLGPRRIFVLMTLSGYRGVVYYRWLGNGHFTLAILERWLLYGSRNRTVARVTSRRPATTDSGPNAGKAEQNKTKGKSMAWLMTTMGFFSVAAKGKPGEYQIRARQRGDLENLIRAADLRGQKIISTDNSDYAFRIVVLRDELDRAFEAVENSITYDNVKSAVGRTPGQEQHASLYHSVWSILGKLQAGGPYGQRTGGRQPQRSLLDSERDERTFGDSPSKRTIHATDSHVAHSALDDVEPTTSTARRKRGSGRKTKSEDQALPDRELDFPTSETNAV
jgi:hypothetical protein